VALVLSPFGVPCRNPHRAFQGATVHRPSLRDCLADESEVPISLAYIAEERYWWSLAYIAEERYWWAYVVGSLQFLAE
jgi:hypothetical protein